MKIHPALKRWLRCKRCAKLARFRRNVVPGIGSVPCDVLFIGEAPGKTEDLLAEPFIGQSGRILRQGIIDATKLAGLTKPPSKFITNVVACRPTDEQNGDNRAPLPTEIARCRPRLAQTVALTNPKKVVLLGDVAYSEAKKLCPDGIKLRHPAYVGRRGGIGSVDYRVFTRGLAEIFGQLKGS